MFQYNLKLASYISELKEGVNLLALRIHVQRMFVLLLHVLFVQN